MIELNEKTKLKTMMEYEPVKDMGKYFIYTTSLLMKKIVQGNFLQLKPMGWNMESAFYGYRFLCQNAEKNKCLYPVYEKDQCKDDKYKKDVNLIYFPTEKNENKPYIILCAGGAYVSVCSLIESYPVAARFHDLGYPVFVLNYRVGGSDIMPRPLDDLAAAIKFIRKNMDMFKVRDEYIVCGFSAGGNLTALWGTSNHGYKYYGLPKPKALFPIYPAVNSCLYKDDRLNTGFLKTMFGNSYKDKMMDYDVDSHVDESYPPCYIVNCEDDEQLDYRHSLYLKNALENKHIPVKYELGKKGGHSFGEGRGTDVEGWYNRAAEFERSLL